MDAHEKLSPIGLALCGFVVIIVITMAVFSAIPNIFFGYRSSDNERTIHMTRLASNIGTVCMSLHEFESTVIDAIVTSIAAEYEEQGVAIDHIEVESRFDEESLQWFTAINSAAHAQNLEEMSVDQIKELCAARLACTFSLFGEEKITLHITIHKLDPNEWMEKLSLRSFNVSVRCQDGLLIVSAVSFVSRGCYFGVAVPFCARLNRFPIHICQLHPFWSGT